MSQKISAREELRASQSRLSLALTAGRSGIFEWESRSDVNVWSHELLSLYGLESAEFDGTLEAWVQCLVPEDQEAGRAALQRSFETGLFELEFRIRRRDNGEIRWMYGRANVLFDDRGKPAQMLGINVDITERKRAQEALRSSEERLHALVTATSDVVYRMSPDWSEMLHLRGRDFIPDTVSPRGDWLRQYIQPEDQPAVMAAIQEAIRTKGVFELEHRVLRVDGSVGWTFSRAIPLMDGNGEIAEWFGTASDVTKRKEAEEAVRASEQQFRTLANAIPQLCWMANSGGWIDWYNDRWYQYTGTTPQQMEGWGWQSVHDPTVLPVVLERWRESLETGKPLDIVFPLRGADGVFRPFLTRVMPVFDHDGKVARWFGTNTDISEQRKTEEALRESEERLRLAQQAAGVGTFDLNVRTGVNTWSPELERLYGLPPGGFRRTQPSWESLVHPDDRTQAVVRVNDAFRTGEPGGAEWRVIWPDGSVHWLAGHWQVLKDESGTPLRLTGANIDITERKLAEDRIRQLNAELENRVRERTAQLEAANKELESFAYSVSHDLRAPLRGIDGWSLALIEDYAAQLDDRAQKFLERVRAEAQRMGMLIDDMLQLSRLTRADLASVPVDLSATARNIVERLREAYPQRRIEIDISPRLSCTGDSRLLEAALTNLFENAVKFTGPRDVACIAFGREKNGERPFFIRDNGVGFDMEFAGMLFGAFQRLHKSSEFPGTGIGLATVQRIIHRHGGRVWAKSEPDQGATFYFTVGGGS